MRKRNSKKNPAALGPRYLQIARDLRQAITDGRYPVGAQLPTEHELCRQLEGLLTCFAEDGAARTHPHGAPPTTAPGGGRGQRIRPDG